jgi:hypothetical protein
LLRDLVELVLLDVFFAVLAPRKRIERVVLRPLPSRSTSSSRFGFSRSYSGSRRRHDERRRAEE